MQKTAVGHLVSAGVKFAGGYILGCVLILSLGAVAYINAEIGWLTPAAVLAFWILIGLLYKVGLPQQVVGWTLLIGTPLFVFTVLDGDVWNKFSRTPSGNIVGIVVVAVEFLSWVTVCSQNRGHKREGSL